MINKLNGRENVLTTEESCHLEKDTHQPRHDSVYLTNTFTVFSKQQLLKEGQVIVKKMDVEIFNEVKYVFNE